MRNLTKTNKQGNRTKSNRSNIAHTYKFVQAQLLKKGYLLLSTDYKNAHQKLDICCTVCSKMFTICFHNFKTNKNGCPHCAAKSAGSKRSIFENEVKLFLARLVPETKMEFNDVDTIFNPKTGRRLELDIYFPSINKAIECNSTWHRFDSVQKRDEIKAKECLNNGIDLLVINELDWKRKRTNSDERNKLVKWLKG